jgi:hypothetical protein
MSSRHQALNGADSVQDLADAIALVENAGFYVMPIEGSSDHYARSDMVHASITPSCIACSEPALPNNLYCQGHDRLGTYRVTDEKHWAANE